MDHYMLRLVQLLLSLSVIVSHLPLAYADLNSDREDLSGNKWAEEIPDFEPQKLQALGIAIDGIRERVRNVLFNELNNLERKLDMIIFLPRSSFGVNPSYHELDSDSNALDVFIDSEREDLSGNKRAEEIPTQKLQVNPSHHGSPRSLDNLDSDSNALNAFIDSEREDLSGNKRAEEIPTQKLQVNPSHHGSSRSLDNLDSGSNALNAFIDSEREDLSGNKRAEEIPTQKLQLNPSHHGSPRSLDNLDSGSNALNAFIDSEREDLSGNKRAEEIPTFKPQKLQVLDSPTLDSPTLDSPTLDIPMNDFTDHVGNVSFSELKNLPSIRDLMKSLESQRRSPLSSDVTDSDVTGPEVGGPDVSGPDVSRTGWHDLVPGLVQLVTGVVSGLVGYIGLEKIQKKLVRQPPPDRFLGEGSAGIAYLVGKRSQTVVRKIFSGVEVLKSEFVEQMELLVKFKMHENILTPKSYFFQDGGEKWVEYDYFPGGSLMTLLHGAGTGRTKVEWKSRVKIALGAAKGLAHIHATGGRKFFHGNIKSSNVLVNDDMEAMISDIGLIQLMTPQIRRSAGYQPPEVTYTQASDIYSFGVLLLELVSGRHPLQNPARVGMIDFTAINWGNFRLENYDPHLITECVPEHQWKGMSMMVTAALCCILAPPICRPEMKIIVKWIKEIPLK